MQATFDKKTEATRGGAVKCQYYLS